LCPDLGCGSRSVCQLEGNVCIPKFAGSALPSRTADTPYCAAYTCMSFEDASCFCTGAAGKTDSDCSSPAALAGLCVGQGHGCSGTSCCAGLTCTDDGGGAERCEQRCTASTDCTSGCCTDRYDTGVTICADASACTTPCKKHGEMCQAGSDSAPNNCCRGACIQSDNPDFTGCRPTCTTSADCPDTGCCLPSSNGSSGFCVDARYCSCPPIDAPCGGNNPSCCDGTACVGSSADDLKCLKVCTAATDCPNLDCTPLSDNSMSVCLTTASNCSALGAACSGNQTCCNPATCLSVSSGPFTCYKSCKVDTDCASGQYCMVFSDGSGVCYQ
jgi:hypothetical protein